MRLGDCKVIGAHGIYGNELNSRRLTRAEIDALADAGGELRENGTRWASEYGKSGPWRWVMAMVDSDAADEPAFNSNPKPSDVDGKPLTPGDYEVRRGGEVRLATVFEDDACALLVRFAGSERTQRVDECAKGLAWGRITTSDVR